MERTTEQPIIADTSGLVSLATDTDQNHKPATKAAAQLRKASRPILLPFDVLVETINVLGKKSGHETARKAASELLHPESQFLLIETGPYLFTALEKFKDQPPAVSLTDCIVMSVADEYGTKDIFGFDKQFAGAGEGVSQVWIMCYIARSLGGSSHRASTPVTHPQILKAYTFQQRDVSVPAIFLLLYCKGQVDPEFYFH